MDSFECVTRRIRTILAGSQVPEDPLHAENTLEWLLKLKPDADEALQVAALGHDIERAIEARKVQRTDFADYDAFKAAHARNSAEILKEVMEECNLSQETIDEVYQLVCRHESGGDPRANLLKDADSLSFFDVNLPLYYARNGWAESRRRCVWGYRRLSPERRSLVQAFSYEDPKLNALLQDVIGEERTRGS